MTRYTAFCREPSDTGTTWIDSVEADTVEEAILEARICCASDWNYLVDDVACIGLAEGNVKIIHWEDLS